MFWAVHSVFGPDLLSFSPLPLRTGLRGPRMSRYWSFRSVFCALSPFHDDYDDDDGRLFGVPGGRPAAVPFLFGFFIWCTNDEEGYFSHQVSLTVRAASTPLWQTAVHLTCNFRRLRWENHGAKDNRGHSLSNDLACIAIFATKKKSGFESSTHTHTSLGLLLTSSFSPPFLPIAHTHTWQILFEGLFFPPLSFLPLLSI